ncbi:unnamed protein product [Diatraea saccharalis]|uniref:NAD-dependent epimerase/dehydratase domain-containing protein n=1 Tax=Diatraea saccharalis TaxID=40085 RepID=A0A9N9RE24_9NEOP|nr:unnamed protein product [Diatraea saccharalis]
MKIVVTGAAGFLGSKVADLLLSDKSPLLVKELVLADTIKPAIRSDPRVTVLAIDLTSPDAATILIDNNCDVFFHLAAIVSGHAEVDFDLGFRVNFDATRALLEAARRIKPTLKFVFSSTLGVYGGKLPNVVNDFTAATPENTYGATKAMSELMINDYSRKGFVDGRILRLPTVVVRAGAPNKAVTSFASGIIREPLNGLEALCPVDKNLKLWLTSPQVVVWNIIYAATIPAASFGSWRGVNLPGFVTTVDQMIQALKEVAGEKVAALVRFVEDETVNRIVSTLPTNIDNSRALSLGFSVDVNFVEVVKNYIKYDLPKKEI